MPLPAGVDPVAAVSVGIPGIAAWLSLDRVARLAPGKSVLVLGATGSAGWIAVQVAKLLGAGRVVAAGRHREALQPLTELGADAIVVLGTEDDSAVLRAAAPPGFDVVFDPVFGPPLAAAVPALVRGGRSVTIGMSAGGSTQLQFGSFLGRSVLSHANQSAPQEMKNSAYEKLITHLAAGRLQTRTEQVALAEAEQAWARQRQGSGVKLVLTPEG